MIIDLSSLRKHSFHPNDCMKNPDNSSCYHVDPSLDEPMPRLSKRGVKSLKRNHGNVCQGEKRKEKEKK